MTTLFQETAVNSASSISEEKTLSILSLILEGGIAGQIIIALLLGLLTVSLYIYFERFFAIKSASKVDKDFMNQIKDQVANGNLEAAKSLCASVETPVSNLIGTGISRIGKPLEDINTAIENAGKLEIYKLEKTSVSWQPSLERLP
jgi:biopolymer transport protein ExbB